MNEEDIVKESEFNKNLKEGETEENFTIELNN